MAELSTASVNDLPDSDFAYIEDGGTKDSSGRTTPRSLRHFPIHDAAHVRNALARASSSPFGSKAMPKIRAAAHRLGVEVGDESDGGRSMTSEVERRYLGAHVKSTYEVDGYRLEARSGDDGPHIAGYGAVFNRRSKNLGGFVERVGAGTFQSAALGGYKGAVARYNHDGNILLGTTQARTLTLSTDSIGLHYDVRPPQSRRDIVELVERGDVAHSSFAFRCLNDEWGTDDTGYPLRTLADVELIDVAPVVTPAYADATAGLRSLAVRFDAAEDEVRSMAANDELRRFFVRTDNRGPAAPKPVVLAASAMLDLMARRDDPWAHIA